MPVKAATENIRRSARRCVSAIVDELITEGRIGQGVAVWVRISARGPDAATDLSDEEAKTSRLQKRLLATGDDAIF
jgi:hypothetical protein